MKKTLKLSKKQNKIAYSKKRFILAVCGRRFGKSVVTSAMAIEKIKEPNSIILWVCPNSNILKDNLEKFIWLCPKELIKSINKSEKRIIFKNNSVLYFVNGKIPSNVMIGRCNLVILEDAALMKPVVWKYTEPLLKNTEARCLLITSPAGKDNWIYLFFKDKKKSKDWAVYHYTTKQGGFVTNDCLQRAKKTMPKSLYRQEFLAKFVTLSEKNK